MPDNLLSATLVGIGGLFGTISRYALSNYLTTSKENFPIGILTVNLIGCFLFGLLAGQAGIQKKYPLWLLVGTTGFCGGFTTFSTFSAETLYLLETNRKGEAISYVCISVLGGLLCTWLGYIIARRLEI